MPCQVVASSVGFLALEEVFGEEEDVCGAFGQAAHEVGIPFGAEGEIDADAEAFGDELALEVAADAVEELELKGLLVDVVGGDEAAELVDDGFVVGGDAAEDGAGDEDFGEFDVVGVDIGLAGEGDGDGFFVGAFAEAHADALGKKAMDVLLGAEEVGLKDGADGAGKALVEALGEGDGRFGVFGAFHVDADEGADVRGVGDHVADDAFGEGWASAGTADVHADLGEFDADVGAEVLGLDGVEELVVDGGGLFGLGDLEDGFAEGVE